MDDKQLTTQDMLNNITNPKYLKFLDLYPKCKCMISETAKAMGIGNRTAFDWLAKDEGFSLALQSLKKDLELELEEKYVNKIESIVDSTDTPPQTQLLGSFFMLKALNPRYKDKIVPDFNISGDIIFQSNIPEIGEVIDAPDVKVIE